VTLVFHPDTYQLLFHEPEFHFSIQWSLSHGSVSSKTWKIKRGSYTHMTFVWGFLQYYESCPLGVGLCVIWRFSNSIIWKWLKTLYTDFSIQPILCRMVGWWIGNYFEGSASGLSGYYTSICLTGWEESRKTCNDSRCSGRELNKHLPNVSVERYRLMHLFGFCIVIITAANRIYQ
jgi:hypothetical protein